MDYLNPFEDATNYYSRSYRKMLGLLDTIKIVVIYMKSL